MMFTHQENQAERTHVAVRQECCSSGNTYPRPRADVSPLPTVTFSYC